MTTKILPYTFYYLQDLLESLKKKAVWFKIFNYFSFFLGIHMSTVQDTESASMEFARATPRGWARLVMYPFAPTIVRPIENRDFAITSTIDATALMDSEVTKQYLLYFKIKTEL